MCKSFTRAAVAAALVCLGTVEARDISRAGELATPAAARSAASSSWLAQLVRDSGFPAQQDDSAFAVTVDVSGEPISLMMRSESVAPSGEQVLALWSTLLCVDEELGSAPALVRALAKLTQSDRISARRERDLLVVVYESFTPRRALSSERVRSVLTEEASAVQRALHLLRLELARPSAGG